jgi:DNA ligase-1
MAGLKRSLAALWLALALSPAWPDSPPAAPAMLLAEVYAANVDVTQYWVSEKFDGVRAQWDGRTLRFRGGGVVPAPAWFTDHFPAAPLDGELWIGRNQFDALSGTVRKLEPVDAEWRQVRYLVF